MFFRLAGLPADCAIAVSQNFAPMETGLLQNQNAISFFETWANKRFLLRATRTFEKVSSLQFYLWICSQLRLWCWDLCLFSLEGVVQGNLFCYCLKVLMTVQVFNVTVFCLVWVFSPIIAVKAVEESAFLFAGWLCLCSKEKVKLCGFTASA